MTINFREIDYISLFLKLTLALTLYLAIAVGGLGLVEGYSHKRFLVSVVLLSYAIFFITKYKKSSSENDLFSHIMSGLLIYFSIKFLHSNDLVIFIDKLDGLLIGGIFIYLISKSAFDLYGKEFVTALIFSGVFILLLTIIYKYNFGFFDRSIRFFLNGPIVFSWMMGFLFLLAINSFFNYGKYTFFILSMVFFVAMLWSESKGPVLSVFITLAIFLIFNLKVESKKSILVIASLFFVTHAFFSYDITDNSRLVKQSKASVLTQDSNEISSFSLRLAMIEDSISMFKENKVIGVGVGNYQFFVKDEQIEENDLYYPHNILFEILSEHGVVGLLFFSAIIIFIFFKINFFPKIVMMFFLLCLSFSGDMAYWRFVVFLPIAINVFYQENLFVRGDS